MAPQEGYPCEAVPRPRCTLTVHPCGDRTSGCVDGQEMLNGPDPRVRYGGSVGPVSVAHGLIELELGPKCGLGPRSYIPVGRGLFKHLAVVALRDSTSC